MKKFLTIFCFLGFLNLSMAQEETIQSDEDFIIEELMELNEDELINLIADLNSYNLLLFSVQYNSQTYFLGRDLGIDQFSLLPQLSYQSSSGIYLGIAGNIFSEFDPKWDFTILNGGYGHDFGKNDNLRAEIGYSRYLFSDSDANDFKNSIDAAFHINSKSNTVGASVNGSYLFGERTGFQMGVNVFGDIKIAALDQNDTSQLSFEPSLSFIFGSENIDTSRIDNMGIDSPFINMVVESFETFSLRNTQLSLPFIFDFGNFSAEAGYNINFPSPFKFENEAEITNFFHLGINYLIDLD